MKATDEELGVDSVTTLTDSWYSQSEVSASDLELKTAMNTIESMLDSSQAMEVDPCPGVPTAETDPPSGTPMDYNCFDSRMPELLAEDGTPVSPVTPQEDHLLDVPAETGFSRAPGDGRPAVASSSGMSGRRITGRPE